MTAALAHHAALDALRAGLGEAGARKAASEAIRPGGIVQWDERYTLRRAVETATEEDNMTSLNEAQAAIMAVADKLTAAVRAKGYDRAHVDVWVGYGAGALIRFDNCGPIYVPSGPYLDQVAIDAGNAVSGLPIADALAYAEELSGPLVLMSEHYAQAAE